MLFGSAECPRRVRVCSRTANRRPHGSEWGHTATNATNNQAALAVAYGTRTATTVAMAAGEPGFSTVAASARTAVLRAGLGACACAVGAARTAVACTGASPATSVTATALVRASASGTASVAVTGVATAVGVAPAVRARCRGGSPLPPLSGSARFCARACAAPLAWVRMCEARPAVCANALLQPISLHR